MKEFPAAENVPKIMQFLRMINELQVPNMAEENTPIRGLEVNFAGIHVAKNIICYHLQSLSSNDVAHLQGFLLCMFTYYRIYDILYLSLWYIDCNFYLED